MLWDFIMSKLSISPEGRFASIRTLRAVRQGLGDEMLVKRWTVHQVSAINGRRDGYVKCGQMYVYGFYGHTVVFSEIRQTRGQVVADFFQAKDGSIAEYDRERLLKSVILSKQIERNGVSSWRPQPVPEIRYARPSFVVQNARLSTINLQSFLLADEPVGTVYYLDAPKKVYPSEGRIKFSFVGGRIGLSGFAGYDGKELHGAVIVEANGDNVVKRIYFWENSEDFGNGKAPVVASGHLLAVLDQNDGVWKLATSLAPKGWIERNAQSTRYAEYLLRNAGARNFYCSWAVARSADGRVYAYKNIRRHLLKIELDKDFPDIPALFSATMEIQGSVKLVEFYPDKGALMDRRPPVAARFISIKTSDGWNISWVKLDDAKRIGRLLKEGILTKDQISRLYSDDYLTSRHRASLWTVVDKLLIGD